jgi:hypothetical protein
MGTAKAVKATKATTTISVSEPKVVILTPATQKQVKNLREGRDLGKQAKEMSDKARQTILETLGQISSDLVGTDAKGKRLIAIKVIPSSERIDFEQMKLENPELYELVQRYKVARGAGEPTLRVDVL